MEEDFSHQNDSFDNQTQGNSFHDQTQLEPHSSLEEMQFPPAKADISLEATVVLAATTGALLTKPQNLPVQPKRRLSLLIKALVIALLVLILLLTGTSAYAMARPHLSSGSASVHITFDSQQLGKTYTTHATVGATDPTLNPIGAHKISITTPVESLTVPATGKQHEPATYGSGLVQLIDGCSNCPIPASTYDILSYSGVEVKFTLSSPSPHGVSPYILAKATKSGPGGNIKLYDIDSWYNFPDADAYIFIINRQPFSGGHNASTVTVVSQADIDSVISRFTQQLKSALPADQAKLKSQLAPSERLLDPIQCQSSVAANRNANDQASEVTAAGTMTCSAIAYSPAKLAAYGASLLMKDAYTQWGGSYILVGQAQEKLYGVIELEKTVTFSLDVHGYYIAQLSPGAQVRLASLIAGKTQADAQALLLQQVNVVKVSLQVTGGLGTALPSSPKDIHIILL